LKLETGVSAAGREPLVTWFVIEAFVEIWTLGLFPLIDVTSVLRRLHRLVCLESQDNCTSLVTMMDELACFQASPLILLIEYLQIFKFFWSLSF